jgi:hypothetical protein
MKSIRCISTAVLLCLVFAAVIVAGCGSGSTTGSTTPHQTVVVERAGTPQPTPTHRTVVWCERGVVCPPCTANEICHKEGEGKEGESVSEGKGKTTPGRRREVTPSMSWSDWRDCIRMERSQPNSSRPPSRRCLAEVRPGRNPAWGTVRRIAAALEVEVSDLARLAEEIEKR